jgi:hypothetical protein
VWGQLIIGSLPGDLARDENRIRSSATGFGPRCVAQNPQRALWLSHPGGTEGPESAARMRPGGPRRGEGEGRGRQGSRRQRRRVPGEEVIWQYCISTAYCGWLPDSMHRPCAPYRRSVAGDRLTASARVARCLVNGSATGDEAAQICMAVPASGDRSDPPV